jgi:hypothetical protein
MGDGFERVLIQNLINWRISTFEYSHQKDLQDWPLVYRRSKLLLAIQE